MSTDAISGPFALLARHPSYLTLTAAQTLSLVGSVFTGLVIYKTVSEADAGAPIYALIYVLGLLPGPLAAQAARFYRHLFNIGSALRGSTLVATAALLVTWIGYDQGNLFLLLFSEMAVSAATGFLAGYQSLYDRKNFHEDELEALASVDTIAFSAQTLLGLVGGTVLLSVVDPERLLLIDALTFAVAYVAFCLLIRRGPARFAHRPERDAPEPVLGDLAPLQRRAFWIGPILAAFGGPLMSLGPAIIDAKDFDGSDIGMAFSPVLVFLVVRAFGQITGPIVARPLSLDRLARLPLLLPGCLLAYCGLYFAIWATASASLAYGLTFAAHVVSNILFMVAYYAQLRFFSAEEISAISSKSYVYGTLAATSASLLASGVVALTGYLALFLLLIAGAAGLAAVVIGTERLRKGM